MDKKTFTGMLQHTFKKAGVVPGTRPRAAVPPGQAAIGRAGDLPKPEASLGPPADIFQFAGVYFGGAVVDRDAKLIRIPSGDITRQLQERLTRRELERVAAFCERSIVAKDSPMALVVDVHHPFAHFLFEQVRLVLAGGPREY